MRFGIGILLVVLLSYGGLQFLGREMRAAEDFALGIETSSYFARDSNYPIHLNRFRQLEMDSFLSGWRRRGSKPVQLFLGNSQTHAINQLKPGQCNYVQLIRKRDEPDMESMALSIPNASLQEMLVATQWLLVEGGVKIERLILPVFYDDLRESGIRDSYFPLLINSKFRLGENMRSSVAVNNYLNALQTPGEDQTEKDLAGVRKTTQEKSERWLNEQLSENWALWAKRETMRGRLFIFLYQLRNTVFGIDAQTVRKIIPERKAANMDALEDLLGLAPQVQILVYIPPLRTDVQPPYDMSAYELFKQELKTKCAGREGIRFADLQDLVPGVYWGVKDPTGLQNKPEYDFMHFRFEGHQLLDSALRSSLNRFKDNDL